MPKGVFPRKAIPIEDLFWPKVEKTPTCWNWLAQITVNGYGIFNVLRKPRYAHRVAYTLIKGPIPQGMFIDHLCRNRRCVNPEHMEIVTTKENVLRGIGLTALAAKKTHCLKGHPLIEGNLLDYDLKRGHRHCKTCQKEWDKSHSRERYIKRRRLQYVSCFT